MNDQAEMVHLVIVLALMQTGRGVFGYLIWLEGRVCIISYHIPYPISRIIKGILDCMELGIERMDNARKLAAYFASFFFLFFFVTECRGL